MSNEQQQLEALLDVPCRPEMRRAIKLFVEHPTPMNYERLCIIPCRKSMRDAIVAAKACVE